MIPAHSFVAKINERAKGALVVTYVGGPEVMEPPSQAIGVSNGVIDGAFTMAAIYAGLVPGIESLTLSKLSVAEERQRGYYDYLNKEKYNKAGLYFLGKAHDGTNQKWFSIWTVKKVASPKDMVGKRIAGTSPAINEFLKGLNAAPAVIGLMDLYTAIERGVVDGHWITRQDTVTYGLMSVERYMIDHPVGTSSMTQYVNLKFWNQLPKNLQDIVQTAANEVSTEFGAVFDAQDAKDRQAMEKAGIQFVAFSPADVESWYNTFYTTSWAEFVKRYPDFGPQIKEMLTK